MKKGEYFWLAGFENNKEHGTGDHFNWILSNGDRSKQRGGKEPTKFTHMFPKDAHSRIRSVHIHYAYSHIGGFSFFDKDGARIWQIGLVDSNWAVKTVEIAENERIVGVVANLYAD